MTVRLIFKKNIFNFEQPLFFYFIISIISVSLAIDNNVIQNIQWNALTVFCCLFKRSVIAYCNMINWATTIKCVIILLFMPLVHMSLQTKHVEDDNSNLSSICIGSIFTHDSIAYFSSTNLLCLNEYTQNMISLIHFIY